MMNLRQGLPNPSLNSSGIKDSQVKGTVSDYMCEVPRIIRILD